MIFPSTARNDEYRLRLPRDEIAFRIAYEPLVRAGTLTTVFRPGDRRHPHPKSYQLDEELTARIVEKPGDDASDRAPVFSEYRRRVRISSIEVLKIDRLDPSHFKGSSPDVQSREQLRYHLGLIYDQHPDSFDLVTRFGIEYL